jgi:hypothetical protein
MIPEHEWLAKAQQLSVGMRVRVRHGRERRLNMTVANERDRWWCYCQACKEGGVVHKEHVLLSSAAPIVEHDLVLPTDMKPVYGSEYEQAVGKFLASKGMMFPYLPKLWYSVQSKRVLLQDDTGEWHGRDLTNRSNAKWLHYAKQHIVGTVGPTTILHEDIFSMYKVRYALRHRPDIGTASTLGAGCSTTAALALKNCTTLVWAYDGDSAGDAGYRSASKRMRVLVPRQLRARPPEGKDPKDMDCEDIRKLLGGLECNLL